MNVRSEVGFGVLSLDRLALPVERRFQFSCLALRYDQNSEQRCGEYLESHGDGYHVETLTFKTHWPKLRLYEASRGQ